MNKNKIRLFSRYTLINGEEFQVKGSEKYRMIHEEEDKRLTVDLSYLQELIKKKTDSFIYIFLSLAFYLRSIFYNIVYYTTFLLLLIIAVQFLLLITAI